MKLSQLQNKLQNNTSHKTNIRKEYQNKVINNFVISNDNVIKDDIDINNTFTYNQSTKGLNSNLQGLTTSTSNITETTIESSNSIDNINNHKDTNIDNICIIGITGSRGKSTTAYLVHEAIKAQGYKSVLYSSIMVDSPASYITKGEHCEIPLRNNDNLLDIICEAQSYGAEYLVLEINSSAIVKGLTQDIPFNIRALTNLNRNHDFENYTKEEYASIKKSFFQNISSDDDCTCIFGMTGDFTREEFNSLLNINNHKKRTFGTKYICTAFNADYTNIDYLLYGMEDNLNGLNLNIRIKDSLETINTKIILPHNSLNITCAIAILDSLNIYDASSFKKCMETITIPGREEIIKVNNRTIIIGMSLIPMLEVLKTYKQKGLINNITVIDSSHGSGYKGWGDKYKGEEYKTKRQKVRKFAMKYLSRNADNVILTSNDPGTEDPYIIASELKSYLENDISSTIEVNRKEAIRIAIITSNENDVVYIAGRGNRRVFCNSRDNMELFTDKEVVLEVLSSLGWR